MKGLHYVSWADNTGYAVAARSYLRALARSGLPLRWTPMKAGPRGYLVDPGPGSSDPSLAALAHREVEHDTVLVHTVPEYFPEWIERARAEGRRIFGYTVWELDRLPRHWPDILNRLDGVLVPCTWNVEVFRRSGVTVPLHAVPHLSQFDGDAACSAADRERWWRRVGVDPSAPDKPFVFYTIGFWSNRKAPYLALEAYWRAFEDRPATKRSVLMIVKTCDRDMSRTGRSWRRGFRLHHPHPADSARRLAARHRRAAPFLVVGDESLDDTEMLALHEIGDCFVSLARAEGWGLGTFEAARRGRPVVSTRYGGQTDYLEGDGALLVDFTMVPVHEPAWCSSYSPGDLWAEPSVEQAAALLRSVYDEREAAKARAATMASSIRRRFGEQPVLRAMLAALDPARA